MEKLIEIFRKKIASTETCFMRSLESQINWSARLVCIRGSRGTGKTTLILQHIKKTFSDSLDKVLYVSLDNLYFSDNSLLNFVDDFVKRGGKYLFLDEVHKYPDGRVQSKTFMTIIQSCTWFLQVLHFLKF